MRNLLTLGRKLSHATRASRRLAKSNRLQALFAILLVGPFLTINVQAELIPVLNGQAVYDTSRHITWLANTNLAATEKFGVSLPEPGYMNVAKSLEWLEAMNDSNYLGYNAWRLPTALVPDSSCTDDLAGTRPSTDSTGWHCTGSEFGKLFYEELGGTASESILDSSDPDVALFSNFVLNQWYWTGTEHPSIPGVFYAFAWHTASGGNAGYQPAFQGLGSYVGYAWPVADGNPFGAVVPQLFYDVEVDHWAYPYIQTLALSGITVGCGDGNYCPGSPVSRAQMAVFLERCMHGRYYNPPAASGNVFLDVEADDFAASFIEQLFIDGVTAGCGNNNYCPDARVTRSQMAVFLLRAKHGSGYSPPAATGIFSDVPLSYWAVHWIEQLAAEGITVGCGGGNYCPEAQVTRDQMAVFLVRACGL